MDSKPVIEEQFEATAIVRLNRPDKLNALSAEMITALTDFFTSFKQRTDLRAIILTGTGNKAFCAGTDIAEIAATVENTKNIEQRAREISERGQALCNLIENCGLPVIAAINGIAAGGGFEGGGP